MIWKAVVNVDAQIGRKRHTERLGQSEMCRVYSAILSCAHVSGFIAAGISVMDTPYRTTGGVRL